MNQIKKNDFTGTLIIIIFALLAGCFFIQVFPFGQRAVDAGLVLSNIVNYPDKLSPMPEYWVNGWTSTHQISKFFLALGWSFSSVSKLIIFLTTIFYFLGISFAVKLFTKSTLISILIAILVLILQKNFGDTDYPSMIFSEHTYGMMSLALVTFIFGLLFNGNLLLVGFVSALLISVHLVIGAWLSGIIFFSLIMNKYFFKFPLDYKKIIQGFIIGIIITIISFIYYFSSMIDISTYTNWEAYNYFMKNWDGHRTQTQFHFEYLFKTLLLFISGVVILKKNHDALNTNYKFAILCILISIFLSTVVYFIYKIFISYVPNFVALTMPTRFAILHSVIGWPLILGILFVLIQKLKIKNENRIRYAYFFIFLIIFLYSASHYKVFVKSKNLFLENTNVQIIDNEEKIFWGLVKNSELDGYIVTSFSSSTIAMRKGLKPILLDVSSLDFVPYFPNTAANMAIIIEKIYGVSFSNPPPKVKNRASLSDEIIKLSFEKYSKEKWLQLSQQFNISAIIVPENWDLDLTVSAKDDRFAFYIL